MDNDSQRQNDSHTATRNIKKRNYFTPTRSYNFISDQLKNTLIQTVLHQRVPLKKISKQLNINYATAKTIIYGYKSNKKIPQNNELRKSAGIALQKKEATINVILKNNHQVIREYSLGYTTA